MIEYHKIDSVYLRDPETKFRTFLDGQWTTDAFAYLANLEWTWTEKIDGTNVRIGWDGKTVQIGGRTKDAQMPMFLLERLNVMFPAELMATVFPDISDGREIILFGEGYGAKIQKGGVYLPDRCDFILFDVLAHAGADQSWLPRTNVEDVALKLGIKIVPVVGSGPLTAAIDLVCSGLLSEVATTPGTKAEGLVMRPAVDLLDRRGRRVITKVKAKDFA